MQFQWLLFDADNTLLDFSKASKDSLWKTLDQHGIICSDSIYKTYHTVNAKVWEQFEREEITAVELRPLRFARFFESMQFSNIDPLLFNQQYLQNLVNCSEVYQGVEQILTHFKSDFKMSIVTNGLKEVQKPRLKRLNLMHYFDSVVVSDEIGVAKPHHSYFEHVHNSISNPPPKEQILMIGDNLHSDILGGRNFGLPTCWISHGKNNKTAIKPDFTIKSISELPSLIQKISESTIG